MLVRFESHTRYSACIQEEGDVLCCGVDVIVILKLCTGEEIVPIVLPLVNKETKELLQFLVDPLHLSISLGVVCSSGCQLNSEKSVQLLRELHYKLGASV